MRPLIEAVAGLRDVRDLAAFLGEFERIGGHGLFGSYVDTDDRNSDRYLVPPRPGRARAAGRVLLPRRQVRRDPGEVRRLPDRPARARPATRTPERRGRDGPRDRHPAGGGPLGARRDPRRPEDLQPADRSPSSRSCARRSTGTPTSPTSAAPPTTPTSCSPRSCVRQPSYFAHLSTVLERGADRGLEGLAAQPRAAVGGAVPHRRLRRDQLRLLRPHPQRHTGAAGPLEARRRAGRGRDRRGGRQGVRRPALPADVQGADGRAGREPARGLPPVDLARWTG